MATAIALLTRDLRVRDNSVLAAAQEAGDRVVPLFVLDDTMLRLTPNGRPNRFGFLCECLHDLDSSLRARGAALFVRRGNWVDEVVRVAQECDASSIHVGRDVSGYAQARTARLTKHAPAEVVLHDTISVVAPDAFAKPYVVFTPYRARWLNAPFRDFAPLPHSLTSPAGLDAGALPVGTSPGAWTGGETAALARFRAWTRASLRNYDARRDAPGADATSRLSPYLHFGCLSPSEVAAQVWERVGAEEFVRQLCWRDFFAQLLWFRPTAAHTDLRDGAPRWRDAPGDVEAWKAGRTGFPFVDAGMRQLRAEGWMHNRARMVAASFLTRDLRVDWREGAQHFLDLLVDGDIANNQLNWQWIAGTGTDTNPDRVLNPTVQARTHDPDGTYIRRWIPELADCATADIHDPPFDVRRACGYEEPILDHNEAIEMWRELQGG